MPDTVEWLIVLFMGRIILRKSLNNRVMNFFRFFKKYSSKYNRKNISRYLSIKNITNIPDLDRELATIDVQFKISDDSARAAMGSFRYKIDKKSIPENPCSKEYYDFQMGLYSLFSGRQSYHVSNEETIFNHEDLKNSPFPYSTQSASTVGDQLLAIGYIIKMLNLPAKSEIIEFGPGWGNLTIALSQMGYQVTCVEVEKRYIDLIRYRSEGCPGQIDLFHQDMLEFVENSNKKYDAAIFYESFHHCHKPFQLLKNLSNSIKDDGVVCFASEPFVSGSSEILPYPWGIRLDGMSLWSMRRFGWMELGFEITFFKKVLADFGFESEIVSSDVSPLMKLVIAKKIKN